MMGRDSSIACTTYTAHANGCALGVGQVGRLAAGWGSRTTAQPPDELDAAARKQTPLPAPLAPQTRRPAIRAQNPPANNRRPALRVCPGRAMDWAQLPTDLLGRALLLTVRAHDRP